MLSTPKIKLPSRTRRRNAFYYKERDLQRLHKIPFPDPKIRRKNKNNTTHIQRPSVRQAQPPLLGAQLRADKLLASRRGDVSNFGCCRSSVDVAEKRLGSSGSSSNRPLRTERQSLHGHEDGSTRVTNEAKTSQGLAAPREVFFPPPSLLEEAWFKEDLRCQRGISVVHP